MSRVLLDTHAALWILTGEVALGPRAEAAVADRRTEVLLSTVVVWEVAIKRRLGKLDAPDGFAGLLLGAGARALPISVPHASGVEHLPDHHRDPFDRLLIAQAQHEGVPILTRDPAISRYDVSVVW